MLTEEQKKQKAKRSAEWYEKNKATIKERAKQERRKHRRLAGQKMPVGSRVHCEKDNFTGIVKQTIAGVYLVKSEKTHRLYSYTDIYPAPSKAEIARRLKQLRKKKLKEKRDSDRVPEQNEYTIRTIDSGQVAAAMAEALE